jgi:hypothetical protein
MVLLIASSAEDEKLAVMVFGDIEQSIEWRGILLDGLLDMAGRAELQDLARNRWREDMLKHVR